MRKRLQLALMASPVIATFLSLTTPYVQAEPGASSNTAGVITTNDENGRKVYVNEGVPASTIKRSQAAPSPRRSLVYWSVTKHRWKAVPPANGATMRAARSAAAEVNRYLGQEQNQAVSGSQASASDFVGGKTFTQQELDAAIACTPRHLWQGPRAMNRPAGRTREHPPTDGLPPGLWQ